MKPTHLQQKQERNNINAFIEYLKDATSHVNTEKVIYTLEAIHKMTLESYKQGVADTKAVYKIKEDR